MQVFVERVYKKPLRWMSLAAIGLLIPLAIAFVNQNSGSQLEPNQSTVEVTVQDLTVRLPANGVVQAARKINLSPSSEGQITQLLINEGDFVEQGTLIAQMSSQKLQAQRDQALSTLAKAEAELSQKRSGSLPEEIAEAEARVNVAEANILETQAALVQAQSELNRNQQLVTQGAVARKQLDEAIAKEQEARANLHAAQSRLREQQESLNRVRNGTRVEEIMQAEANVAEAKAQVQYQQAQLAETQIYAPFSGIITRLFVQEGNFVAPTTASSSNDSATSASIAELSSGMEIEAKIPEATITQIQSGQVVEIRSDAYPHDVFQGRVKLVAPRAVRENNITTFAIKITPDSGQNKLRLGMNVRLNILGDSIHNALVLPLAAIVTQSSGETGVLIWNEHHQSEFRPVRVGVTAGEQIQILEGVTSRDRVLLSPINDQSTENLNSPGLF
jgi:HlyD family secretion protein